MLYTEIALLAILASSELTGAAPIPAQLSGTKKAGLICGAAGLSFSAAACGYTGHKAASLALAGAASAMALPLADDAAKEDRRPSAESAMEQGHGTGPDTHEKHEMTDTKPPPKPEDGRNKALPEVPQEKPETPVASTSKNKLDDKPSENGGKLDPKPPSVNEEEVEGKGKGKGKGKAVETKPPSVKEDEVEGKGKGKAVEADPKSPKPEKEPVKEKPEASKTTPEKKPTKGKPAKPAKASTL